MSSHNVVKVGRVTHAEKFAAMKAIMNERAELNEMVDNVWSPDTDRSRS